MSGSSGPGEAALTDDGDRSGVDLADVAGGFAGLLHDAGVSVNPGRAARFAAALHAARPHRTEELYWLGRVTLATDRAEIATYDRVFTHVFRGLADIDAVRGDQHAPPLERDNERRQGTAVTDAGDAGGAPTPSPIADRRRDEENEPTSETARAAPATRDELLRRRDFADCTPGELAELRRIVAAMQVDPPMRASHRMRRQRHGAGIDRRATLRRARRTGGHPLHLVRRDPTLRRRRVILLADVSGSMEAYSRVYLYVLHGAVRALRAETFVFATRLTRLTRELRQPSGDPQRVLREAVASVADWSGGTRIGEALTEFNDRWGRRGMARGAVVVIVSDGWESGDPAVLGEQMARLSRLAHRIVWVNPRAKSEHYLPLAGGMAAALPHVDAFASGHTLGALEDVLAAVRGEAPRTQGNSVSADG